VRGILVRESATQKFARPVVSPGLPHSYVAKTNSQRPGGRMHNSSVMPFIVMVVIVAVAVTAMIKGILDRKTGRSRRTESHDATERRRV
jgi:hypothetical protein